MEKGQATKKKREPFRATKTPPIEHPRFVALFRVAFIRRGPLKHKTHPRKLYKSLVSSVCRLVNYRVNLLISFIVL